MTTYDTPQPPLPSTPATSGLAIASLVTGLTCLAPVAIICGHVSLSQIKKSAGQLGGRGIALAGVILGYVGLASYLFIIPSILFVGARAWKKGSDRAQCIMTQRNIQQMVRGYQTIHQLPDGAPLDFAAVQAEMRSSVVPVCPTGGPLEISPVFPPTGEMVATCPHGSDQLNHVPKDHTNW